MPDRALPVVSPPRRKQVELEELRREVAKLRAEWDVLKKTLAHYLGEEQALSPDFPRIPPEVRMRKKQAHEQETIVDPAYWHLLPEKKMARAQKELEDTLEAALDEGFVDADKKFWADLRARFIAKVTALETAKK